MLRNGRRIEEEKYVNDITLENTEVLSSIKGNISTNYTYGYTRLTASTTDTITVYVQNSYRDVVLEVENNSVGTVQRYGLYGEARSKDKGFGYRSEYHEGYLQYLRARYYDTESGRFISKDTYLGGQGSSVAFNRYTYTLNNPMKYIDKDGHMDVGGVAVLMSVLVGFGAEALYDNFPIVEDMVDAIGGILESIFTKDIDIGFKEKIPAE